MKTDEHRVTRFILVRHVETEGNVQRRFNGHTESPYTPRGERMKDQLTEILLQMDAKTPIDALYVSPTERALHIGEQTAARLGLPLRVDPVLREFNFGIFDGLTAAEAEARDKQAWDAWMADYNHVAPPGGESYTAYHQRLGEFLSDRLRDHAGDTVLIIAHGGTVHSLLTHLLDLPLESKWHFAFELGGIAVVECPEGYGILKAFYTPEYK
jgi:alpha-ribazole phosphatase